MRDVADELLQAAQQRIDSWRKPIGSTYRLQLHSEFTFRDAAAIVPYLSKLGITHIYASPYFKAKAGSTHGYDVTDHCRLNPELGSQDDYDAMITAIKSHGMHHILDMVPNHVGIGNNDNAWWNDVLEKGDDSAYANYFDITWGASPGGNLTGRVLLPILGDTYATELESGKLQLRSQDGRFYVGYGDRELPISAKSSEALRGKDPASSNGAPGDAHSFDPLDTLLRRQSYRLAHWKTASDEINYRRFFDINDLAGLAMERQEVFDATHKLVLSLLASDQVAGLRIDHPDGLRDPKQYFERLQKHYVLAVAESIARERRLEWNDLKSSVADRLSSGSRALYVVVEKILALDEPLIDAWPVAGTTGYEFLNYVNGLFVDTSAEERFSRIYHDFIGDSTTCDKLIYEKKKLILEISLASELNMLAITLKRIAEQDRYGVDYSLRVLHAALKEIIACFPVYRSYVTEAEISEADRTLIARAIGNAQGKCAELPAEVFAYIGKVLTDDARDEQRASRQRFAAKFQQLTAPVTAKGIEDTTFYIYNRLLSLNEVGSDPSRFGIAPDALHDFFADRQKHWPTALSALSTHDTKRSEDVRARINVLSELPGEWEAKLTLWRQMTAGFVKDGALDSNEIYAIFQTLLGAWPFDDSELSAFEQRVQACVLKSMREAKVHTRWTDPNEAHEQAVAGFVHQILLAPDAAAFRDDFTRFQRRISQIGMINSLSQTLIKLTAPGVPDTYQGSELWDLSLVDPDNRRPVDYAVRTRALEALPAIDALMKTRDDGRIKLAITQAALGLRRSHLDLFERGSYLPLRTTGALAEHVFAFARQLGNQLAIVLVPRLIASHLQSDAWPVGDFWQDAQITLPIDFEPRQLKNVLTGSICRTTRLSELFSTCPVALLSTM